MKIKSKSGQGFALSKSTNKGRALAGKWLASVRLGTIAFVLCGLPKIAWPADGDLDPSFGNGGTKIVRVAAGQRDFARAVAVQPDGRIVVGGELGDFGSAVNRSVLMRLLGDGSLDASFGNGGLLINSAQFHLAALVLQPDGKIVTTGARSLQNTTYDFTAVRYLADGTLDQTFGNGGYATNGPGNAEALALQPDGKIVLAGTLPIFREGSDFLVGRFNPDGSPDLTFGNSGRVTISYSSGLSSADQALAVAVQADGKIVVAGFGAGIPVILVRYNSDGSIDSSFGLDGSVFTPNFGGTARRILIDPDGKIIVGGGGFVVGRYNSNGGTDQSFGNGGRVSGGFGSGSAYLYGLARQADGKLLAGGSVSYNGTGESVFALSRYNANGTLDSTFGTNGFVLTNLTVGTLDEALALTLQPGGEPVLAGYAAEPGGSYHDFALARYLGPMAMTGAVSRKTHGSAGAFDLDLPLTGTPGVECRSSGGDHTLVFTFNRNVVDGDATMVSGNATIAGQPTYNGNTLTVHLTGVTDAQTVSFALSNVRGASGATLPARTLSLSLRVGDSNGSNSVTASDVAQTKASVGAALSAANFRSDFNLSGTINATDVSIAKAAASGPAGPSAPSASK